MLDTTNFQVSDILILLSELGWFTTSEISVKKKKNNKHRRKDKEGSVCSENGASYEKIIKIFAQGKKKGSKEMKRGKRWNILVFSRFSGCDVMISNVTKSRITPSLSFWFPLSELSLSLYLFHYLLPERELLLCVCFYWLVSVPLLSLYLILCSLSFLLSVPSLSLSSI